MIFIHIAIVQWLQSVGHLNDQHITNSDSHMFFAHVTLYIYIYSGYMHSKFTGQVHRCVTVKEEQ